VSIPIRLKSIPLWVEHWSEESLRKRYSQEPRAFERGFRLKAFSDDEATFPSFSQCEVPGITLGEIQRSNWPKFTGVDLSSKKRPGNTIATVAVDPKTRRRYPIDIRYGAWRSSETAEQIRIVDELFSPMVIMVEDNAYQEALLDWISDDKSRFPYWVKIEATTTTGGRKSDLEKGLPGLEVEFSKKGWAFPLSEYENVTPDEAPPAGHWARLAQELRHHPIAATSDGVMALWFARQGIELYGGMAFHDVQIGDLTVR